MSKLFGGTMRNSRGIKLDKAETATVLAALRYFQANRDNALGACEEHFKDTPALSDKDIDKLCENINVGFLTLTITL